MSVLDNRLSLRWYGPVPYSFATRNNTETRAKAMMPKHPFLSRHTPANGVSARRVPGQMAPERCVEYENGVGPDNVVLIGVDLSGVVRVKIELTREDASAWWLKVVRHWLAWQYGASEIRIVR